MTVVTCAPNHPNGKIYPGFRNSLWQSETRDGVKVVRLWTWLAANEGFWPRILNYVSYMIDGDPGAAVPAQGGRDRDDLAAVLLRAGRPVRAAVKRAPWVLEIRDLWPESIVAVGAMRKGAAIRFLEKAGGVRLPPGRRHRLADARLHSAYRRALRRRRARSPCS